MMTRETDVLADSVMNALWFSDRYMPTKDQPKEEINAGKLAREYVFPILLSVPLRNLIYSSDSQVIGRAASVMLVLGCKRGSKRVSHYSSKP